jgi:PAS domain S-box-containing protein
MKLLRFSPHITPWIAIALVIGVVLTATLFTNITLRSVEKTLPNELLKELNDLTHAFEHLSETASMAQVAKVSPTQERAAQLRSQVETLYGVIVDLRETYVFDNMIRASDFHAVVAPAIADLRIWLSEGISGHAPHSATTLAIVHSRIKDANAKAKELNRASRATAHKTLEEQLRRLDNFLFAVNLLFVSTIGISCFLIGLLLRQRRLQLSESTNIEALRLTKRNLQEHEELDRRLMATLPDIIIRLDLDGMILYINDVALQTSGYRRSEIVGRNMIDFVDAADQERAIHNSALMLDGPLGPREYNLIMKDGSLRRFEVNGEILRDPGGTPYGMVQVCRDIRDRHRLEVERKRLQDRLHRAEKMEALGTLAGGVAHDLNNVLGGLVGYAELMMMEIPEDDPLHEKARNILDSGLRGAAIIQDLLSLARRGVTVNEVVNLNTLIRQSLHTPEYQKLLVDFPGIAIRTDLAATLMNTKGSPVNLSQSITNLVFNAVEAIDERGHITIKTENIHLDAPISAYDTVLDGDYVKVSVSDDGQGIAGPDLEKIFEPFYTKKKMGRSGTGLGLAVVWGTVKDHGGYVDVQSRPEKGTTFTLYFPATREHLLGQDEAASYDDIAGAGESILVIDDVQVQREVARRLLERLGYRVETVPSGEAAVEYIASNPDVDIIVLDMIMDPGIDGLETYRRIIDIKPGQKAIIVSGYSETSRVKAAQSLGAGAYVRKPYRLEILGGAIRTALDGTS